MEQIGSQTQFISLFLCYFEMKLYQNGNNSTEFVFYGIRKRMKQEYWHTYKPNLKRLAALKI